ncbi:MAG: UDP-N-acetylmuramoyl-L-alanine--D-glutamate ligase [Methylococcales bacterium]|nr:UDP-N-acetylmuramoyl-L-alanine--D-glutamate ligase [Methylococcales bacterium]
MRLPDHKILENFQTSLKLIPKTSKIVIVGLGITGFSVVRFLKYYQFQVTVIDNRDHPAMAAQLQNDFPKIELITGKFNNNDFKDASHLIVSPGLSLNEAVIKRSCANGAKIISDIDLFALATETPIVAITGSNGKSTVTTMLGEMAESSATKTALGGNLGTAALNLLDKKVALYVLELSSFQLERTHQLNAAAATVLNISEDHLDRHSTLESYIFEKTKIFNGAGAMILNQDDAIVRGMQCQARKTYTFSINKLADFHIKKTIKGDYFSYKNRDLLPCTDFPLQGLHNRANVLAALALGYAVNLTLDKMCNALKTFKGLSHRMQTVAHIKEVTWVNDSKATNVGACIAALEGFSRTVILLAGGDAKGADMTELTASVHRSVKEVIVMGKDALLIERALKASVPIHQAQTMAEAVKKAHQIAVSGDTVLLSPACASLDQYKNYQQRGESFIAAVRALELK